MTFEQMIDKVINRIGFEDERTIRFCEIIEQIEKNKNSEKFRKMVESYYFSIVG